MDGAVASIGGEQFWERGAQVVLNERGNNIFIPKWDDKEVTYPSGIEVVLPIQTGMSAGLWVSGRGRLVLLVCL